MAKKKTRPEGRAAALSLDCARMRLRLSSRADLAPTRQADVMMVAMLRGGAEEFAHGGRT